MNKLFFICLSLAMTPCHAQAAPEEFMISLFINQVDQKKDLLALKDNQQWLVLCNDLENTFINVQALAKVEIKTQTFCQLNTAPIMAEFNEAQQSLLLNVPPSLLRGAEQLNNHQNLEAANAPLGAYLNYDALYKNISQQRNYNELSLKNDFSLFKNNVMFKNSMIMHHNDYPDQKQNELIRLFTQFSLEQPEKLTTLQIGDSISPSSPISRGVYFAGLQYGTSFMQRPGFVYWNIPTIQGSALTPSTVDLYINGVKNYSAKVNPGEFNIQSGALFNGDGSGQMVIEDILGNKSVQYFDLSMSDQLLRKGMNDYNISLGRLRYDFDNKSNDYRNYFTNLYYRSGLSNTVNLGFNTQYSKNLQNFGAFSNQYIPHLGILNLGAAYSNANHHDGHKFNLGLSKSSSIFNLGLNSEYNSENYQTLGMEDHQVLPKLDNLFYFGINRIPYIGHLTFNYVEQSQYKISNLSDRKIFSIRGGKSISDKLYCNYGLSHESPSQEKLSFDISLSYQFDDIRSSYLSKNNDALYASFNKIDQEPLGIDYSFSAGETENNIIVNADSTLKNYFGDLNFRYYQNRQNYQAQANFKGALAFIDGSLGLTKSIEYPFALVRLSNQPNLDVYKNNEFVGKTNKNGELFVHRLIAYTNQDFSYNQDQLPIEYETPILHKNLVPYDLRGYIIEMPIIKSLDVNLKLTDAQNNVLASGSLIHSEQNPDHLTPVGSQGLVTLYGLLAGHNYQFEVQTGPSQQCHFAFQATSDNITAKPITAVCE